ncbi:putative cytokinetic ring protein SteA [Longirhabdus pacifica]|uniref:putative cytokinetic ring protein SteA n=1 Tax=Longirhabdus pacifica TaxID=2305227 RepID=UPI001008F8E2|nr:putative cytokinetic ring protein SteA [Longirhabdus pacifica]
MRLFLDKQPANIKKTLRKGKKTKQLLQEIQPGNIALITHEDMDEIAALGLIESGVHTVINASETMSGTYPAGGARLLLEANIPLLEIEAYYFDLVTDGANVFISSTHIQCPSLSIPYKKFDEVKYRECLQRSQKNLKRSLASFIDNTLQYAQKEKEVVLEDWDIPEIKVQMNKKHVVIVTRGSGYKEDLNAIRNYIHDEKPVLIGVDGGADALLSCGFQPHIIIGDMDSISDDALRSNAEIIVHAYVNGTSPGLIRTRQLGLNAHVLKSIGTSEDAAMMLAYEKGAEWIVTLGSHTHMIDFLEKGRKGMASTLLVRMKIGNKLIDAKGVGMLYQRSMKWINVATVIGAGMLPLAALALIHPAFKQIISTFSIVVK